MVKTMLLLVLRFFTFVAIYCAIVLWWANAAWGHGVEAIFISGLITLGAAAVAWIAAIVAARSAAAPLARFAVHVVVVVVLSTAMSMLIHLVLWPSVPYGLMQDFVLRFGGIVAIAAIADGAVGLWNDWRDWRLERAWRRAA